MAYPFPRLANSPQTPQHLQNSQAPKEVMTPKSSFHGTVRRTILVVLVILTLFLWWIGAFSKSPRQTDRIPFSHNLVDEQVRRSPLFRRFTNALLKLSPPFRRTPRLQHRIHRPLLSSQAARCRRTKAISLL